MVPALLLFAAAVRLFRLDEPSDLVFDETYYAKDACLYLGNLPSDCDLTQTAEQSYVHPPLGKWLIAAGIRIFGYNAFGWRISAVIFGVGLVLVAYLITEKLFEDRRTSLIAGLLVATDFLLFVQSRIAMLDIFLAFFVALGLLFVAMDRSAGIALKDHLQAPGGEPPPARHPEFRIGAGVAFGLALAVKWSAVYPLALAGLLALVWTFGLHRLRRKAAVDEQPARRRGPAKDIVLSVIAFGLLPLVVYVGSYSDWFAKRIQQNCPFQVPAAAEGRVFGAGFYGLAEGECIRGVSGVSLAFGDLHDRVIDYHVSLSAEHPYQSKAWTWPLVLRPVAYFYEGPQGRSSHIIGSGNLVVWYAALIAALWLMLRSLRRWRPERVVLAVWAAQYLPWLLVSRPLFFFYMTPAVPFMMIGLAAGLGAMCRRGRFSRLLVAVFLIVGVMGMFALFFPILTAIEIPYDFWRRLMWFPHFECGELKCGWI